MIQATDYRRRLLASIHTLLLAAVLTASEHLQERMDIIEVNNGLCLVFLTLGTANEHVEHDLNLEYWAGRCISEQYGATASLQTLLDRQRWQEGF